MEQKEVNDILLNIANLITFINLILGLISILLSIQGSYTTAALLILGAAVLDYYDGRIARHFCCETEFGRELDSLSDLVSFGIGPVLLIYCILAPAAEGLLWILPLILYPCCGAYRLARFNVTPQQIHYVGLPITVAGAIGAGLAVLWQIALPQQEIRMATMVVVLPALSLLMIGSFKIKQV